MNSSICPCFQVLLVLLKHKVGLICSSKTNRFCIKTKDFYSFVSVQECRPMHLTDIDTTIKYCLHFKSVNIVSYLEYILALKTKIKGMLCNIAKNNALNY